VLAATLLLSFVSVHLGGTAMVWHLRCGYLVFTLLLFRTAWGFVGGRWSRFASFAWGPGAVWRYLRGRPRPGERFEIGHNPLGGLSVWFVLAVLAVQVGTGLVADDEIATTGPLNRFVGQAAAHRASGWHTHGGQWLIAGFVALHLTAIVVHLLRQGQDLIGPMLSGDKTLPAGTPATADDRPLRLRALAIVAAAAAVVAAVVALGG
jgi:cytochrome b